MSDERSRYVQIWPIAPLFGDRICRLRYNMGRAMLDCGKSNLLRAELELHDIIGRILPRCLLE